MDVWRWDNPGLDRRLVDDEVSWLRVHTTRVWGAACASSVRSCSGTNRKLKEAKLLHNHRKQVPWWSRSWGLRAGPSLTVSPSG